MIVIDAKDLKTTARCYSELRAQAMERIKKMKDHSLVLFKAFLQYISTRNDEDLGYSALLDRFLSEELGLDGERDMTTRLSLMRRFYNLTRKNVRNPNKQRSLSPYL